MTFKEWPAECTCGWSGKLLAWDYDVLICPTCGAEAFDKEDVKYGKAPGVISDDIPGGIEIRHGLVNADGSPRRFYSKTDMKIAANEAGLKWSGDTPGKPYQVRWSGKRKESKPLTTDA
jgi:hypothetical protein